MAPAWLVASMRSGPTAKPVFCVGSTMTRKYRKQKGRPSNSYILIGDGFDELEVVHFLHQFRNLGLPIKSVSLFNQMVKSRQGVALKTDLQLADKPFDIDKDFLLILPTGGQNEAMLRRDPRLKRLLQTINAQHGRIAITDRDSVLARDVSQVLPDHPAYQPLQGQNLPDFIASLTTSVFPTA